MSCRQDRGRAEAKGIVCLRNGRAVRGAVCAAPHRGEGEESIGARATACGPASGADDSTRVSARRTAAGREPAGNLRPGWRTGRFPSGRPTVRGRDASRRFPLWRIPLWIAVGHAAGCRRGSAEAGTGDARRCVIIARSYVIRGIRARSFAMNKLLSPHPLDALHQVDSYTPKGRVPKFEFRYTPFGCVFRVSGRSVLSETGRETVRRPFPLRRLFCAERKRYFAGDQQHRWLFGVTTTNL